MLHPPYSPDLAPSDFLLFPRMKSVLKEHRFDTVNAIKEKSLSVLRGITSDEFSGCFWKQGKKNETLYRFPRTRVNYNPGKAQVRINEITSDNMEIFHISTLTLPGDHPKVISEFYDRQIDNQQLIVDTLLDFARVASLWPCLGAIKPSLRLDAQSLFSGVVPFSQRLFEPLVDPPGGLLSVAEGLRHNLVHGEVAAIFIQAILDLFKGYPPVCAHHFVDSSHVDSGKLGRPDRCSSWTFIRPSMVETRSGKTRLRRESRLKNLPNRSLVQQWGLANEI
ncbi:hypothetical protein LAZ67_3002143 [Cordylochernes scorpioides]|uniref:Transposase n=1 Tax=Cordylochernes scorpioides TaxID=51811 RepID=A0ABY6KAG1_9ARAC|nr:hypothetical protein LAZ67_3002143 [Cordylochernes scorpioides]